MIGSLANKHDTIQITVFELQQCCGFGESYFFRPIGLSVTLRLSWWDADFSVETIFEESIWLIIFDLYRCNCIRRDVIMSLRFQEWVGKNKLPCSLIIPSS